MGALAMLPRDIWPLDLRTLDPHSHQVMFFMVCTQFVSEQLLKGTTRKRMRKELEVYRKKQQKQEQAAAEAASRGLGAAAGVVSGGGLKSPDAAAASESPSALLDIDEILKQAEALVEAKRRPLAKAATTSASSTSTGAAAAAASEPVPETSSPSLPSPSSSKATGSPPQNEPSDQPEKPKASPGKVQVGSDVGVLDGSAGSRSISESGVNLDSGGSRSGSGSGSGSSSKASNGAEASIPVSTGVNGELQSGTGAETGHLTAQDCSSSKAEAAPSSSSTPSESDIRSHPGQPPEGDPKSLHGPSSAAKLPKDPNKAKGSNKATGSSESGGGLSMEALLALPSDHLRPVRFADFERALAVIMPSDFEGLSARYEEWNERYGSGADLKRSRGRGRAPYSTMYM